MVVYCAAHLLQNCETSSVPGARWVRTTGDHRPPMRYARLAAVAATASSALAALIVFTGPHPQWLRRLSGQPHASGVQLLIDGMGRRRLLEARLSGGFPYVAASPTTRADAAAGEELSLLAAIGEIQKRADADPTPDNVHALGVAELLLGRHNSAVSQLEAASAATPGVAEFYADLSSAYIARAHARKRPSALEDLARAVDAAERALELVPPLQEARFNLALALEGLGLRSDALAAWKTYLRTDTASGWSSDAKGHLDAMAAPTRDRSRCLELQSGLPDVLIDATSQCPQEARELGEALLSQWGKAVTSDQAGAAAQALARADRVAELLVSRNGDRLLRDSVDAIRSHPARQRDLAKGYAAFEAGRALYNSDKRHLSIDEYIRARTLLRNASSPYWLAVEQSIATLHTHKRELRDASRILENVDAQAQAHGYLALQARSLWLYGTVKLQMSDPAGALDEYQRATTLYDQLGERGNLSNVSNAAADTQRVLGDFQRGWSSLSVALANLPAISDPIRRYLALYNGALYAQREHLEFTSLHFQDEALAVARMHPGPGAVIEASISKAAILGRLHRHDDALSALNEVADMSARLEDPQQRAYMMARVAAAKGELLMLSNPAESVRQLGAAIQHFSIAEPAEIPRLRLLEGEAYARGADESRAASAFLDGAKTFEDRLRKLRADQQRVAYSDEGWEIYRQLVELRVHQGALDEALLLSDRARSRASDDGEARTSIARLRGLVDPSQRVVFYTVLQRETHAWVFGGQGVAHHTIPIGEGQLERMVSQAERLIVGWHRPATLDALLSGLYATLITPLDIPETAREVIFVPDGPLRLAPFAAMRDRNGHHLVERWAVVVAHSLESLTRTLEHQDKHHDRWGARALVVGDPKFDTTRSASLPDLPFAAREAKGVSQLYTNPEVLVGIDATRARVMALLPTVDVFHFAGHAIANDEFPDLSRLLLTPEGGDTGDLLARDLQTSRLKPGSIVILSACQTGAGLERRAAGIQSLARAFLAVGANDVIAASWDVDDRDTSELMTTFHEHLSLGDSPAESLRVAQLKLISAGRPVSSWAAFVSFTGAINGR
jgi:CHAT domain-containing protein